MSCCNTTEYPFNSEAITVVSDARVNPFVEVFYLIDGEWHQSGVFTEIKLTPGTITVDHGGVATGVIKVS